MPEPGLISSKVRAYMESLSPTARAMLVRSLRSASSEGDVPSELILAAVEGLDVGPTAEAARRAPEPVAGEPWSVRLEAAFFAPLTPFLTDEDVSGAFCGRIGRRQLPGLWTWIRRDVASDAWERALAADPYDADADPTPIARKFRREAVTRVVEMLRDAGTDPRIRQKIMGQIGGEQAYRVLTDVAYVLQNEAAFANLFGQLPANITTFDVAEPCRIAEVVRASMEQVQMTVEWIAAAVIARTNNPVVAAHLACRLAGSADPRLVASSRYAAFVDIVLAQIERNAALAAGRGTDPRSRAAFFTDLRAYHDAVRGLAMVFSVESVSGWFRRIGAAKVIMSEAVTRRIDTAAGLVRRALRVESTGDEYVGRFDTDAFDDAEFAVRLSIEVRAFTETLAVNEIVGRTRKQIENTLEVVADKLMADLKSGQALDRRVITDAVDGAIRLATLVFGEDYAAAMRKSRDNWLLRAPARTA